jgi:DNA polymerase-4
MDYLLNKARPVIMHIDLNSCFAIIEQQANPLYRNKPVVVAAYDTPRGMVIASSYEAKAKGIKLGVNVAEAKALDPGVIVLMPDVPKIFHTHRLFREVLQEFTSNVYAKSVDEFVIDFTGSPALREGRDLIEVGYEIKHKVKNHVGSYITVNVGIGTNRFWAKTAAGLNKPDGLDVMDAKNAEEIYSKLSLTDLTGINYRYEARLNAARIYSPLDFLESSQRTLKSNVFHSIVGNQWYSRLRGWEVDNVEWEKKSVGHNHAIGQKTADVNDLARLLIQLVHKVGRRMRKYGYSAQGIHLSIRFQSGHFWSKSRDTKVHMYSDGDIYFHANRLLSEIRITDLATNISVSVYKLMDLMPEQRNIFGGTRLDNRAIADACDDINDRWGEYTIIPAAMIGMDNVILRRVAFGSVKDIVDM